MGCQSSKPRQAPSEEPSAVDDLTDKARKPKTKLENGPRPPKKNFMNKPGRWNFMISYTQRDPNAALLANNLYNELKGKNFTVWQDIKAKRCDTATMQEAVENSDIVLAVITSDEHNPDSRYFGRDMCVQELNWAIDAGTPIIPVTRQADKSRVGEFIKEGKSKGIDLSDENFESVIDQTKEFLSTSIDLIIDQAAGKGMVEPTSIQKRGSVSNLLPQPSVDESKSSFDAYFAYDRTDLGTQCASYLAHLLTQEKVDVFFDEEREAAGHSAEVWTGIEKSTRVVLLVTSEYLKRGMGKGTSGLIDPCSQELQFMKTMKDKEIIVVVADQALKTSPDDWRVQLKGKTAKSPVTEYLKSVGALNRVIVMTEFPGHFQLNLQRLTSRIRGEKYDKKAAAAARKEQKKVREAKKAKVAAEQAAADAEELLEDGIEVEELEAEDKKEYDEYVQKRTETRMSSMVDADEEAEEAEIDEEIDLEKDVQAELDDDGDAAEALEESDAGPQGLPGGGCHILLIYAQDGLRTAHVVKEYLAAGWQSPGLVIKDPGQNPESAIEDERQRRETRDAVKSASVVIVFLTATFAEIKDANDKSVSAQFHYSCMFHGSEKLLYVVCQGASPGDASQLSASGLRFFDLSRLDGGMANLALHMLSTHVFNHPFLQKSNKNAMKLPPRQKAVDINDRAALRERMDKIQKVVNIKVRSG